MLNKKKDYFNPEDPYYCRKVFNKMHSGVYNTDLVMSIISPKDHRDMMDRTRDEIKKNSKDLMKTYCDKEQVFYAKKHDDR